MTATITIELTDLQSEQTYSIHQPPSSTSQHELKINEAVLEDARPVSILSRAGAQDVVNPSNLRIALTIIQPCLVNFFSSFSSGIITVGLPAIAESLSIPDSLYLWPASVFGLACGATLLIAGSITDLIGARNVEIAAILFLSIFVLAQSISTTGIQFIVFRALQGIGLATHIPASVSLLAAGVPEGKPRNFAFACYGLSQPLGFSVGLVSSGVMIQRAGWRSAFYLSAAGLFVVAIPAFWILPRVKGNRQAGRSLWTVLRKDIDWVGGLLASGCLAMLAYVLAILSADVSAFKQTTTIVLFTISVAMMCAFPLWMHYRERSGKPALVPNSIWKNTAFTTTCVMIAISYGVANSSALFSSLFFQEIQHKSTITTSLYLLPNLVVAVLLNLTTGLMVHRLPARWLVAVSSFLCAISPLMMALVPPAWNYWYLEFWAQILAPLSLDVLFTIGLIIVSNNFPKDTQALAGAVFSTVGTFGHSFGIGMCQLAALGVMAGKAQKEGMEEGRKGAFAGYGGDVVLDGFRAAFWLQFACMIAVGSLAVYGLRKTGKVGLKRE